MAHQAANLASDSAAVIGIGFEEIVSLVDVVDEKVCFPPIELMNAGFKVIAEGMPLAMLPIPEATRVQGNVFKYLAACIGHDYELGHRFAIDIYFPRLS